MAAMKREHAARGAVVEGLDLVERGDVAPRYHQQVHRSERTHVVEGDEVVVLGHHVRRDLPGGDLAEDARRGAVSLRRPAR